MNHQTAKIPMQSAINNKWSHVKLSPRARSKLRTAIRQHPDAAEYLRSTSTVSWLTKDGLLDLAAQLGIDHAVFKEPAERSRRFGSALKWLANLVTT